MLRLERLPISRELTVARIVIGSATFFDAYTVLAIAYAMPVLAREWNLTPGQIGAILSAGYLGQFFGALFFGWLAERIGRLNVLLITVVLYYQWIVCAFCVGRNLDDGIPICSGNWDRRRCQSLAPT